jgi:hypothetical protein
MKKKHEDTAIKILSLFSITLFFTIALQSDSCSDIGCEGCNDCGECSDSCCDDCVDIDECGDGCGDCV